MFGTYRFILSGMVVIAHLWPSLTNWTGVYAVFGFYMLSGYLMCLVLNERYGFSVDGFCRFAINRALRIYPPYLAVLAGAILIVLKAPQTAEAVNIMMALPEDLKVWLHNIFIFGLNHDPQRLIPAAWSVDVEIFFYLAMGLFLARDRRITIAWFIFSVCSTAIMIITGQDFDVRYSSILAASLPFSMGAMLYYFRDKLLISARIHVWISIALFLLYAVLSKQLWASPVWNGFYISLIASIYVQLALTNIKRKELPPILNHMDTLLGDLSYTIFLSHWHAAVIIAYIAPKEIACKGPWLFMSGLALAFCIAFLINRCVEKPIAKLRDNIRTTRGNYSGI